jgi:hypothetical protein
MYIHGKRNYMYTYIYAAISKGKRKTEAQENCLPFTHHANRNLSFVRLLTKKQTEVIRVQTD